MALTEFQKIQYEGLVKRSLQKDPEGKLTILDLSFKKTPVPVEDMEYLISIAQKQSPPIKTLIIASSSLKAIPKGIKQLRSLKHLNISDNQISTIQPTDLPYTLTHLNLSDNPIPNALAQLKGSKIKSIIVSGTRLTSAELTPTTLKGLPNLEELFANHNELTQLPSLKKAFSKKFSQFNFDDNPLSDKAKEQLKAFETGKADEALDLGSGKVYSQAGYDAARKILEQQRAEAQQKQEAQEAQEAREVQEAREAQEREEAQQAEIPNYEHALTRKIHFKKRKLDVKC